MTLMPVWSGCLTGWRSTTPGAWISTRRMMSWEIAPLPSMGSPSGLTTRPRRRVADRDRDDPAGRLDGLAFVDAFDVAKDDDADRVLVEVESDAGDAALELEQLVHGRVRQASYPGDAVTDLDHSANGVGAHGRRERVEALLENGGDVR